MPNDAREQKFERALARHLKNASPDSACPDPETLAAYHERSLSLEEMAQWKEHIAGCARCQESLALVEQTEPVSVEEWGNSNVPAPVEESARPKALRAAGATLREDEDVLDAPAQAAALSTVNKMAPGIRWRWVVPVGALAASVIVWVGVREVRMHQAEKTGVKMAQNRPTPPQMPSSVSPAEGRQENQDRSAAFESRTQAPNSAPARDSKLQAADELESRRIVPVPSAPAKVLEKKGPMTKQKDVGGAVSGAITLQAPEPAALHDNYAKSAEAAPPSPAPVLTGPSASAESHPSPEAKKALGPSATQATQMQVQVPSAGPANTTSSELAFNARNDLDLMKVARSDRRYVITPNERYVWRLGNAGVIERSGDKGQTWKSQNSGVTLDLTSGSATSDKVCWVVGKTGTILLTTDGGKRWKQIPSPIPSDLGGVHAADARHASIWDVPNRQSFETKDGGLTWQRIATE